MNILEQLQKAFFSFIQETFSCSEEQISAITFTLNTDETKQAFGDISSNVPLVLAKSLQQNPRTIAQEITTLFKNDHIEKIEKAGPGFLNFFLTHKTFVLLAQELFSKKNHFFSVTHKTPQCYSLEFVSANPTGPLHLGHGRGGIIGDVLSNILIFLHNNVIKEYYINDAGAQIQKLGDSFKIRCQQILGHAIDLPENAYHGEYLIELAQQCVQKYSTTLLEKNDSFFVQYAKNHLLEDIKNILIKYGITFDIWFSEKTLHDNSAIQKAVDVLTKNGFTYEHDSALWFTSKQFGDDKDRVLIKTDGSWTYIASDVAYLQNKINRGAEKLIMVIGQDHHSYVVRLKGILQALGYNPKRLTVILYQLVTLKKKGEQIRMSKRTGTMITLKNIIDTVGTDVARFFYLNRKADAHLEFDLDLALKQTEENPLYYIQYAYVRTKGILNKAYSEHAISDISHHDAQHIGHEEHIIIKKIISLKNILETISRNYQTHLLTYYVLELAKLFHSYYAHHKVIDQQNIHTSRGRLMLIQLLQNTFELCLNLLGITTPEKM